MSNYNTLKGAIQAAIKTNGNNEITGQILQDKLLSMITTLGFGYQFMGIANPNSYPGTPDAKIFYIAYEAGTYVYMGGIVVTGLCVLRYDTNWVKEDIPVSGGGGGADFTVEPTDLNLSSSDPQRLKFANRLIGTNITTGKNYIIVRADSGVEAQFTVANAIYEIRYDFDLNGGTITIPSGSTLFFNGGSFSNGTIALNECEIIGYEWVGDTVTFTGNTKTTNSSVSWFKGASDSAKLTKALSYASIWPIIKCGKLTISQSVALVSGISYRSVTLIDGLFNLSSDLFTTSLEYVGVPNFSRCVFNGNGNKIFGSTYGVFGTFDFCTFNECSIFSSTSTSPKSTVQSLTVSNSVIDNDTVNLVKCIRLYDTHLFNLKCEAQTATLIDTSESSETFGGTLQLFVSECLFEGFTQNPVFNLSGGTIKFERCYFEANQAGCANITKNASANSILNLEISGCYITTTAHDAFVVSGFTKGVSVKISVHHNSFNAGGNSYYLISGSASADEGLFALYENRRGQDSDRFSRENTYLYDVSEARTSGISTNTTYFTRYSGGYYQFGQIVFLNMVLLAKTDIVSSAADVVSGLPGSLSYQTREKVRNTTTGEETETVFSIGTNGKVTILGPITNGSYYTLRAVYYTSSKKSV